MKSSVDVDFSEIMSKLVTQVHKWSQSDFDDLNIKTIDKYRIISLFLDTKGRKALENARRNHAKYKEDNMSRLYPEAFSKLFIAICKLHTNPLNELEVNNKLSAGAFKRLIEHKEKEVDELQEEIQNLQDDKLKDYVHYSVYKQRMKEYKEDLEYKLEKQFKEKYEKKLKEKEEYYKIKIAAADKRAEEKYKFNQRVNQSLSKDLLEPEVVEILGDDI
jgi:hypothetical protein